MEIEIHLALPSQKMFKNMHLNKLLCLKCTEEHYIPWQ